MEEKNYYAYLLRIWREGDQGGWRASLENPHTGEKMGFADMEKLFVFLAEVAGKRPFSANSHHSKDKTG